MEGQEGQGGRGGSRGAVSGREHTVEHDAPIHFDLLSLK